MPQDLLDSCLNMLLLIALGRPASKMIEQKKAGMRQTWEHEDGGSTGESGLLLAPKCRVIDVPIPRIFHHCGCGG